MSPTVGLEVGPGLLNTAGSGSGLGLGLDGLQASGASADTGGKTVCGDSLLQVRPTCGVLSSDTRRPCVCTACVRS